MYEQKLADAEREIERQRVLLHQKDNELREALNEASTNNRRRQDVERESGRLRAALLDVKARVEKNDAWWMDDPERGGIDVEMIDRALMGKPC